MITLDRLNLHESAVIASVEGEGALRRHLLDLGLTPGTRVRMVKMAPLGDPLGLFLRGYELSLRKEEARMITVNREAEK